MNKAGPQVTESFFMPTKIFTGKSCINENTQVFDSLGTKALLVTGKNSAKMNGSEHDVRAALEKRNIPYAIFDGVRSNPTTQDARHAAELGIKENADFVIGIGGGSPLDAAKVAAILLRNTIDDEALFSNAFTNPPAPLVAIPTTAGTGSEVTQYSMMTDDGIQNKRFVISHDIFPKIAFLDASYTDTLPRDVTINTAIDALSHSVESYLSKRASAMSRIFASEGMRLIGACLPNLRNESRLDFTAREKLLYASMLAGIAIAQTGTTAAHAMGYSLTYFKKIEHGRANGLLMHAYLHFLAADFPEEIARVLSMLGLNTLDEIKVLLEELLGKREKLSDEEISRFASIAITARNIPFTLKQPDQNDLAMMYRKSFL